MASPPPTSSTRAPDPDPCAVCLEDTTHVVHPCAHAVCAPCLARWLEHGARCPVCRGTLLGASAALVPRAAGRTVRVDFPRPGLHAGITLQACDAGVRVTALDRRDRAHACGLRRGDVITHINALPMRDAHEATRMADCASARQVPLDCHLLLRRRGCVLPSPLALRILTTEAVPLWPL
jgi:hypothetical protein